MQSFDWFPMFFKNWKLIRFIVAVLGNSEVFVVRNRVLCCIMLSLLWNLAISFCWIRIRVELDLWVELSVWIWYLDLQLLLIKYVLDLHEDNLIPSFGFDFLAIFFIYKSHLIYFRILLLESFNMGCRFLICNSLIICVDKLRSGRAIQAEEEL